MFVGALTAGWPALVVNASNFSGFASGPSASGTVASTTGSVAVSGGSGSYSYSYVRLSTEQGPAPTIFSGDGTSSPIFRALSVSQSAASSTTWRVTVTDGAGNEETDDFTVTLSWENNT